MRGVRFLVLAGLGLGVAACEDDPLKSKLGEEPPPPTAGVQAFIQFDRPDAKPGQTVTATVWVQVGSETEAKVGSYTGRLRFSPEALSYKDEVKINDGLRVSNPNGAAQGELRFAGAAAKGFEDLKLYQVVFEVKRSDYAQTVSLGMEEISAALSLENLEPQLRVAPQIFFQRSGS